ncbi:patatin-like phospholipase domain-containing protein, putative [Eimeria tenella]|uniref:Patatin-like phospholipase domain-containing protein, putative n=1 Tax=Eimeria tenella TaxID=5802 RepID=U6KKJ4_EIMTE|nr:patatin-like phospholipase domain-containing protein, putative [Eimeria tenella]CDJ38429.1 patatin-like phospholipase domain-containing protein, putative [Eimeria tenella]|eukprot:XP_013229267.1 patatin-like phospholipase domain-containing protein, putative [Eimeria tenella]
MRAERPVAGRGVYAQQRSGRAPQGERGAPQGGPQGGAPRSAYMDGRLVWGANVAAAGKACVSLLLQQGAAAAAAAKGEGIVFDLVGTVPFEQPEVEPQLLSIVSDLQLLQPQQQQQQQQQGVDSHGLLHHGRLLGWAAKGLEDLD